MPLMKNAGISKKLTVMLCVSVLPFVLTLVVLVYGAGLIKERFSALKDEVLPQTISIIEMKGTCNRIFAEIQGFAATGDEDEIEEFYEAIENFEDLNRILLANSDRRDFLQIGAALEEHKEFFRRSGEEIFEHYRQQKSVLESVENAVEEFEKTISSQVTRFPVLREIDACVHILVADAIKDVYALDDDDDPDQEDMLHDDVAVGSDPIPRHFDFREVSDSEDLVELFEHLVVSTVENDLAQSLRDDLMCKIETIDALLDEVHQVRRGILAVIERVEDYEEVILATAKEALRIQKSNAAEEHAQTERAITMMILFVTLVGVVFSLISLAIVLSVSLPIASSIKTLVKATKELSRGHLDHRAEITTRDEIGTLAAAFNSMAESLKMTMAKERANAAAANKLACAEKHRAAEMDKAKTMAVEANRSKSEFLANMSHELRTPMNSIIGFTHRLIVKLKDQVSEREMDALETVDRNAKHLLTLLNDLLDLSKIEAGRMTLSKTRFDLNEVIREVCSRLAPLSEEKALNVKVDLPDETVEVEADVIKVRQIVTNLVSNGIKFTENGSVTAKVSTVSPGAQNDFVTIEIEDTGIGISPKNRQRLFRKFTQLDSSTTRTASGTGLGLFISNEFVKMHGGRIEVESLVGRGSTFKVWLPLSSKPLNRPKRSKDSRVRNRSTTQGITILCVDDNDDILEFLRLTFEDEGYDVLLADGYESAIEIATKNKLDLICLDLRMPGKDGSDVIKTLRIDQRLKAIPVIVVSVDADEPAIKNLGARSYMTKPIDPDRLLTEVTDILAESVGRALIVEDDHDTAELIEKTLTDHHIDVHIAKNGKVGLEAVGSFSPSVIILDLMMPVMNGFDFLERISTHQKWKRIPVVILTAKTLDQDEVDRLGRFSTAILTKGRDYTTSLVSTILKAVVPRRGTQDFSNSEEEKVPV